MKKEFRKIEIEDGFELKNLLGSLDVNLLPIKEATGAEIVQRGDCLLVSGDDPDRAEVVLRELIDIIKSGGAIDAQKINYVIDLNKSGKSFVQSGAGKDIICYTSQGKPIKAKTIGQKEYVNSIRKNDIVISVGPAGTGKTYLAVAMAVKAFKAKEVQRIILTRPAVEAGESLGFLPGDLQEKVDPYLRPLYDGLYEILGRDDTLRLKEKETIEIVPLAYMRGRTLDDAFIILDEAQNTTSEQMRMFLTRMGFGSKAVVTGDITQIDLPKGKKSGLSEAIDILKDVKGISFCFLNDVDVVRHEMVKRIIRAYDQADKKAGNK